jgi:NAD(P)-dependent dehydrogenase (short-subunit alcohol dehydrogenase family)
MQMTLPVSKKAILITGASTGIGKACALHLSKHGYKIFAGVRNVEAGEALILESSRAVSPVLMDITKPEEICHATGLISQALENDTILMGLINNAGVAIGGPLEYFPLCDLRYQIEVNLVGQLAVIQSFLPLIRKGKGRIINMGSVCGQFALPFSGAYSASKFALEGATDALRRELLPWKIEVSLIELGAIATPIWDKILDKAHKQDYRPLNSEEDLYQEYGGAVEKMMKIGSTRAISPLIVAKLVKQILETKRPRPRYTVGKDARLGSLSRFIPDRWNDWIIYNVVQNRLPSFFMGW